MIPNTSRPESARVGPTVGPSELSRPTLLVGLLTRSLSFTESAHECEVEMIVTDTQLVRVRYGAVGPSGPEDGVMIRLPADVASELVRQGDAVRAFDDRGGPEKVSGLTFQNHAGGGLAHRQNMAIYR